MGIAWLLTTRGIPHLYYGTEVLMKNTKNPTDAEVRKTLKEAGKATLKINLWLRGARIKKMKHLNG
ncbi:MAG: hypothetical protein R2822_13165 [Spirosomataceae bacterium]